MTYAERILNYLVSIAPGGATNAQLGEQLRIVSHQTVYMTTRQLERQGRIDSRRYGRGHCQLSRQAGLVVSSAV
jgi:hypothetical protein